MLYYLNSQYFHVDYLMNQNLYQKQYLSRKLRLVEGQYIVY
jgi:hypothetical protein